jgi:hypothetical protein
MDSRLQPMLSVWLHQISDAPTFPSDLIFDGTDISDMAIQ